MEKFTLTNRAIAFAIAAGAIAFILALFAASHGEVTAVGAERALIPAIVCAALCWASAERTVAASASAIDQAINRIAQAANGDLQSAIPDEVERSVPHLAQAMEGLFAQLHSNLENVQRLAMYDAVTGLANRTFFRRSCEQMLAAASPDSKSALLFIDLDRFKQVNDRLGHANGDVLLSMVANRLRAVADRFANPDGQPPVLGRLAGDEFTIFFPDIADMPQAERIGRAILFALGERFDLSDEEVSVGASVGIAMRPLHGTELSELMRAADAAMYHAKSNGRGRTEYFSDDLAQVIARQAKLDQDLRRAIEQDQFSLVYQPQIAADSGAVTGAEALLRWSHPDGVRSPASFLARAEETGMIVDIGDWVTRNIAQTIGRWAESDIHHRIAVNISPRQIDDADFFHRLRETLHATGAPARMIEIEITESLAMNCSDAVLDAIAGLRAEGANVAIDDFGTGYSNLARLRDLPVDRVKLDRSLIQDVATRAEARAIAQAVIALVHGIGCTAVAEGIETRAEADVLRVIGCDTLQGYVIARPMGEADFLRWLQSDTRRIRA